MNQSKLSFVPITAHDAQLHVICIAAAIQQEFASLPRSAAAAAVKKPVGRPKRERDVAVEIREQAYNYVLCHIYVTYMLYHVYTWCYVCSVVLC